MGCRAARGGLIVRTGNSAKGRSEALALPPAGIPYLDVSRQKGHPLSDADAWQAHGPSFGLPISRKQWPDADRSHAKMSSQRICDS